MEAGAAARAGRRGDRVPAQTGRRTPGWRGVARIQALVGTAVARRLVLGGEPVPAAEGQRLGLIDEVVVEEGLLDKRIDELIKRLRRGNPSAVAAAKRVLAGGDEATTFSGCVGHAEFHEGFRAHEEKRPASWR